MKTSTIKQRQNEIEAINLLKASKRCLRNERMVKYFMIFLSFSICLIAILNRYLPQMFSSVENIEETQARASIYINLISGAILVASIPLGFYASRMHTEGNVLQDRYENYVFDNTPNQSILKPISATYIQRYAHGIHKNNKKFYNNLFSEEENINDDTAQYEYIKKEVHSDYDLYLSIQPFFLTIWIGFFILIIIIAISFDAKFVETLINILIPSLSAITTICASWHCCQLQMRQLANLINCIDKIESLSQEKKKQYITNKENIRLLADGLFAYRSSAFIIPSFLTKIHLYSIQKAKLKNEEVLKNIPEENQSKNKNKLKPSHTIELIKLPNKNAKPAASQKQQPISNNSNKSQPQPKNKVAETTQKSQSKNSQPQKAKTQTVSSQKSKIKK